VWSTKRFQVHKFLLPLGLLLAVLVACSTPRASTGEPGDRAEPIVHLVASKPATSVNVNASIDLVVKPEGGEEGAMTWTVDCGTVDGAGARVRYTAPSTPGVCTVRASHPASPTPTDVRVTVLAQGETIQVATVPRVAEVPTGSRMQLEASVLGAPDGGVDWQATCGTVEGSGSMVTFLAPDEEGACAIRAESRADPDRFAATTLTVRHMFEQLVIAPTEATLAPGDTARFTAHWLLLLPMNASPTDVTWIATCGTLTPDGLEATFEAPSDPDVTSCDVTVQSIDAPEVQATARVTIDAPVSVHVSPSEAEVGVGESMPLVAVVTGASDDAVSWSAGCGTVTEQGTSATFHAPTETGTCVVHATSVEDVSARGVATLTIVDRDETVPEPTPSTTDDVTFTVTPTGLAMTTGDTQVLRASFGDASPTDVEIVWHSLDPLVASVDRWGRVTAMGSGTTLVTATVNTVPSQSVEVPVTVADHPACPDPDALVDMPDPALRAIVEERVGTPLTCARMLQLNYLNAWSTSVQDLTGLETAVNLERLVVGHSRVTNIDVVASLVNLRYVRFSGLDLSSIAPLTGHVHLESVDIVGTKVSDLTPLAAATNLRELNAFNAPVRSLAGLESATRLARVQLQLTEVEDLSPLAGATALRELWLTHVPLEDLTPLAGLTNLERLDLIGTDVIDVSPLANLTALRELKFSTTAVRDISMLGALVNLEELSLAASVEDITVVANFTKLRQLGVPTGITDLTPLAGLTELRRLGIGGNEELTDLTPLAGLDKVQWLSLNRTRVQNLTGLEGMTALEHLVLDLNPALEDLTPLAGLPNLRHVGLSGTGVRDLSPLVANPGIGEGDFVNLTRAPIDKTPGSKAMEDAAALKARGVQVMY